MELPVVVLLCMQGRPDSPDTVRAQCRHGCPVWATILKHGCSVRHAVCSPESRTEAGSVQYSRLSSEGDVAGLCVTL